MSAQPKEHSDKRPRTGADEDWFDSEPDSPKKKKHKKDHSSLAWFLTWNNYQDQSIDILLGLRRLSKYMIQEEKGKEGTPHLQGVLLFNKKVRWSWLNKECPNVAWSTARNLAACINYCSKVDTRNGQVWNKGFKSMKQKVHDPLEGKTLYPYQQKVVDICKVECEQDCRTIYWLWREEGNIGKSALCKHLALKYGAICIGGTWKDAFYAITQLLENNIQPKIIIFDLCRDMGNKISYTAIEGMKNGMFFSPKYESMMALYNIPHIFIFANKEPEDWRLSEDRWSIHHLKSVGPKSKKIKRNTF